MKKYLAFALLLTAACGKPEAPHELDPYFNDYIQYFKGEADANSVGYGDLDNITVIKFQGTSAAPGEITPEIGECAIHTDKTLMGSVTYKEVHFDPSFKDAGNSDLFRKQTFLHEMGSCAYHLKHNDEPDNVMSQPFMELEQWQFTIAEKQFFIDAEANKVNWFSNDNIN